MISDRIIQIVNYLQQHEDTTYKEISSKLCIKDRYVRYDIDRINDVLIDLSLPLIKKESKGRLLFPKGLDAKNIFEVNEVVFVSKQRISFILLVALFDTEHLNIRKLSKDFEVSRSTIKNDLANAIQLLKKKDLMLCYENNRYHLRGNIHKHHEMMVMQLKKYIYLYGRKRINFNAYETYALNILSQAFDGVKIKSIITWTKEFLDELNCVLTDDSFKWYVSSIVVTIWYDLKCQVHPLECSLDEGSIREEYDSYLYKLEHVLKKQLDDKKRSMIMRLLMYTSRYDVSKHHLPMLQTERIVEELIEHMSKSLKLSFDHDYMLYDGLINHVAPLLGRILDHVEMSEEILSMLDEDAYKVFEEVSNVIRKIDILQDIQNKNEIGYLSIHFIASIKRLLDRANKRILLVCGLGYGTTTLVRETLLSEYQVEIVDTIPSYKLQSYTTWEDVDFVVTTMKIEIECCRKMVQIQPIFTLKDYEKIDHLGISRKNIVSNYYAMKARLDFLNHRDKERVLAIIRDEFGYIDLKNKQKINVLSDLLDEDAISIVRKVTTWKDAVRKSASLLQASSAIDERYTNNMIECMNNLGFYAVIDDHFALLHGNQNIGVHKTKMSLLVSQEAVCFGEKKTHIIFCLASIDPREHIPAVTSLMNITKETNFLSKIATMDNPKDIYCELLKSEYEVERIHKRYES